MTYTYAVLDVNPACYDEIAEKLRAAGYDQAFHKDDGRVVIDMHGIALSRQAETTTPDQQPPISLDAFRHWVSLREVASFRISDTGDQRYARLVCWSTLSASMEGWIEKSYAAEFARLAGRLAP